MKKSNFAYFVFIFINIAVALSCYFYPVSRDEFYYLEKVNIESPFLEYYHSYYLVNPRIGQFFANLISRNIVFEVLFGALLFNAFISVLFLNIYRKLPNFWTGKELQKFLWIAAFFIVFINYFGEMFYYTPYSTNYTFTHVFYLLVVFVLSEYYLRGNELFLKKIPLVLFVIFGVFMGMSNEHVPPILVAISVLLGFLFFLKNKRFPNVKLIVLPLFMIIGYAFLFFAPANKIKQETVNKSVLDIGFGDYISNGVKMLKMFYYYNFEIIILVLFLLVALLFNYRKIKKVTISAKQLLFWVLLFILPLCIVGISPLAGPRLLFFSTSILLIVLYKIILVLINNHQFHFGSLFLYSFLVLFFAMSIWMTFSANQNYKELISEIKTQKIQKSDIELERHLNYFQLNIGDYLNRKIFLESGEDYIDSDASHDTSVEKNLKNYFELKSLKEK